MTAKNEILRGLLFALLWALASGGFVVAVEAGPGAGRPGRAARPAAVVLDASTVSLPGTAAGG